MVDMEVNKDKVKKLDTNIDMEFLENLDEELTKEQEKDFDKNVETSLKYPVAPGKALPIFKDKKDEEKYMNKLRKDYEKSAKVHFWDYRLKRIIGIRGKIDDQLTEFEKNLIMKKTFFEKVGGLLLGRYYMFMGIISKDGDLKIRKVPIREAYLQYKKGLYDIDAKNMLRHNGRVMNLYYEGNPHPINFNSQSNTPLVSSESLHDMFQARLIKQLFQEGMSSGQKWAVGAGAIIAGGMALTMIIAASGGALEQAGKALPIIIPMIKTRWNK